MSEKKENAVVPAEKKVGEQAAEKVKESPKIAAEKTAEKKKPAAKPAVAKETAPKVTVKIQFGEDEYDVAEIQKAVRADHESKSKVKIGSVSVYIKPEEKTAYYVVNSDIADKIGI
jgi:hypothetical protein